MTIDKQYTHSGIFYGHPFGPCQRFLPQFQKFLQSATRSQHRTLRIHPPLPASSARRETHPKTPRRTFRFRNHLLARTLSISATSSPGPSNGYGRTGSLAGPWP